MKINLNNNKNQQIKQRSMNLLEEAFFHRIQIEK